MALLEQLCTKPVTLREDNQGSLALAGVGIGGRKRKFSCQECGNLFETGESLQKHRLQKRHNSILEDGVLNRGKFMLFFFVSYLFL